MRGLGWGGVGEVADARVDARECMAFFFGGGERVHTYDVADVFACMVIHVVFPLFYPPHVSKIVRE